MFKLRKSSKDIIRDMAESSDRLDRLQKVLDHCDEDPLKLRHISGMATRSNVDFCLNSIKAQSLFKQAIKAERDSVAEKLGLVLED